MNRRGFLRSSVSAALAAAVSWPGARGESKRGQYDVNIDAAADFGVVADGVSDNAAALLALRKELLWHPEVAYEIKLPQGTIISSENRWLYGVQRVRLVSAGLGAGIGEGTTFRALYAGVTFGRQVPIHVGSPFNTNTLTNLASVIFTNGDRFNSGSVGDPTITLTSGADAARYAIGNRLFLYGYEGNFFGIPPCPQHFEWRTIAGIAGDVLTLDAPLEDFYDSEWVDVPEYLGSGKPVGKPRILNLDRADYRYPKRIECTRITFGKTTSGHDSGFMWLPCDHLILNQCHSESFTQPSCNRIAEYHGGSSNRCDFDKCVGMVRFEGHRFFNTVAPGTSMKSVEIIGGTIQGGSVRLEARNVTLRGIEITRSSDQGSISNWPRRLATNSYSIENLTFDSTRGAPKIGGHIMLAQHRKFVVSGVSGTTILLDHGAKLDQNDVASQIISALGYGFVLQSLDGSKTGVVTRITENGAQYVIQGTWSAPVAGETWKFDSVKAWTDLGGHTIRDGNPLYSN